MSRLTLKAGEVRRFGVVGQKWLIVRDVTDYLNIVPDNKKEIRVDAGDSLDVSSFKELEIQNPHNVDIDAIYQLTEVDLHVTPPSKLKLATAMDIGQVRSTVQTREDTPKTLETSDYVTIPPSEKRKLCDASVVRVEALIQNISAEETRVNVGSGSVSAINGMVVVGDITAPNGTVISGGAEIWAYNAGDTDATVALMEVLR